VHEKILLIYKKIMSFEEYIVKKLGKHNVKEVIKNKKK